MKKENADEYRRERSRGNADEHKDGDGAEMKKKKEGSPDTEPGCWRRESSIYTESALNPTPAAAWYFSRSGSCRIMITIG